MPVNASSSFRQASKHLFTNAATQNTRSLNSVAFTFFAIRLRTIDECAEGGERFSEVGAAVTDAEVRVAGIENGAG